jgi:hypothetical protein
MEASAPGIQNTTRRKGASHQIWRNWQIAHFWWLAPFTS